MKTTTMPKKTKKLLLAKETVRELGGADLEKVAGANEAASIRTITGREISSGC